MAYGLVIPRYKHPEASTYAPATSRGSLDVLRGMYRKIVRFTTCEPLFYITCSERMEYRLIRDLLPAILERFLILAGKYIILDVHICFRIDLSWSFYLFL